MQAGRLAGFRSALETQGLHLDDALVRNVDDSVAGGHDATVSLLDADPNITALFTTNDLMAYGASQALAENGIRIPQDMSLVGITDIRLAQDMRPALTTVSLRTEELAALSIKLLLDLIENPDHQPRIVRVPDPVLVERSSTARARADGPVVVNSGH
jgi:DNA-binding LacI/PurR family transcriptional regulator